MCRTKGLDLQCKRSRGSPDRGLKSTLLAKISSCFKFFSKAQDERKGRNQQLLKTKFVWHWISTDFERKVESYQRLRVNLHQDSSKLYSPTTNRSFLKMSSVRSCYLLHCLLFPSWKGFFYYTSILRSINWESKLNYVDVLISSPVRHIVGSIEFLSLTVSQSWGFPSCLSLKKSKLLINAYGSTPFTIIVSNQLIPEASFWKICSRTVEMFLNNFQFDCSLTIHEYSWRFPCNFKFW